MRKAILIVSLTLASPAFAAMEIYMRPDGEVVKGELKGDKLIDEKGFKFRNGLWTLLKDNQEQDTYLVKDGKVLEHKPKAAK